MKAIIRRREPEEINFWQSYSDMMAALLLLFVLIIAFSVSMMTKATETAIEKQKKADEQQKQIDSQQEILNKKENELKLKDMELINVKSQLERREKELNKQKIAFQKQQVQLDKLIGVRKELIEKLKKVFEGTSMGVSVDSETGAISFNSKILFDFGKHDLKKTGIDFLNKFFPQYFDVILDKEISKYVAEVIIEGHTDNVGTYLYNLELSQKRAFAVSEYCLRDDSKMFAGNKLNIIRKLVTANGRSFYELKYDKKGKIDLEASRRVEIKFRLKEEDMIKEMARILEK